MIGTDAKNIYTVDSECNVRLYRRWCPSVRTQRISLAACRNDVLVVEGFVGVECLALGVFAHWYCMGTSYHCTVHEGWAGAVPTIPLVVNFWTVVPYGVWYNSVRLSSNRESDTTTVQYAVWYCFCRTSTA